MGHPAQVYLNQLSGKSLTPAQLRSEDTQGKQVPRIVRNQPRGIVLALVLAPTQQPPCCAFSRVVAGRELQSLSDFTRCGQVV